MHVVAVTRWGSPLQEELPELAARLGMVAYDLRLRLAGGLPSLFVRVQDGMEAAGHVEFLRARGHGAVACDAETVPGPEAQLVPVDFELNATAIRGVCTQARRFELPGTTILALVHVACVTSAEQTVMTQEKKFALGRAVLSGGMVLRKTVDRVDKTTTQEQEQMIYMYLRSHPAPCVWKELTLRYEGLGDQRQLTTTQNFATLSEKLRTLAPHAAIGSHPRGVARQILFQRGIHRLDPCLIAPAKSLQVCLLQAHIDGVADDKGGEMVEAAAAIDRTNAG